jgi:uncharacterized damage-inducible protein DinB
MVDVRKLLDYNGEVRHRYLDVLAKLSWDELVENREVSFYSIRNIFIHTLNALDYWLDFLQNEQLHAHQNFEQYRNIEDMRRYMEHVEGRLKKYIGNLTCEGLMKGYARKNAAGETIKVTAEDVLIHVFEEEIHHRGELIALLWQMDVEPPPMGWKGL